MEKFGWQYFDFVVPTLCFANYRQQNCRVCTFEFVVMQLNWFSNHGFKLVDGSVIQDSMTSLLLFLLKLNIVSGHKLSISLPPTFFLLICPQGIGILMELCNQLESFTIILLSVSWFCFKSRFWPIFMDKVVIFRIAEVANYQGRSSRQQLESLKYDL